MPQPKATRRIRLTRNMRYGGEILGPNTVIDVTVSEAIEFIGSSKAIRVDPETKLGKVKEITAPPSAGGPEVTGAGPAKEAPSKGK